MPHHHRSVSMRGVLIAPGPIYWPEKSTQETLTYALDMHDWLRAVEGDQLATVTARIPWFTSGDAQILQISADYDTIDVQITSGFPGKTYAAIITGSTLLGNIFEETVLLPIEAPFLEAGEPMPVPAATTPNTANWTYGPSFDFRDPGNSMYL
jgi:hypothetical protein